jgi:hypothetical protein
VAAPAPDAPPRVLLCVAPAVKNGTQEYDLAMHMTATDGPEKRLRLTVERQGQPVTIEPDPAGGHRRTAAGICCRAEPRCI